MTMDDVTWSDQIISGADLAAVARVRRRSVDEEIVRAVSAQALDTKVLGAEQDGWRLAKRAKLSARLIKDKPIDRLFEDQVWTVLYDMRFSELNASRTFMMPTVGDKIPRQLDVFAKDSETVFIVECTHSKDGGPKSVKVLLDKIDSVRQPVTQAIHAQYGKEPKLKVKFCVATRNVDWRRVDVERANASSVAIIQDGDLSYFEKISSYLRGAARYQFLARYLAGEKIEGLSQSLPATRGTAGGKQFYSFLISPEDLLKISYINHRAKTSNEDPDSYQRLVKPSRLKEIGNFIEGGGKFPTNIVVNFKLPDGLRFDRKAEYGDLATGDLHIPGLYGSAWVIDGQHRLYGYAYADLPKSDRSVVSVLAYDNLPVRDEVEMFVDINTRQVKVSRNLVNEILSSLDAEDPDPGKRLDALYARIALRLDKLSTSPLRDRVVAVAQDKSAQRCVTLTSLTDGIAANSFLGTIVAKKGQRYIQPGDLWDASGDTSAIIDRAASLISAYLAIFSSALQHQWEVGDGPSGFLFTNLGIRTLLRLLRNLLQFIRRDRSLETLEPEELVDLLRPLLSPIIKHFDTISDAGLAFRARGSSLASVDRNCLELMAIMHSENPRFTTPELEKYLSTRDYEGTKRAKDRIDDISRTLSADVVKRLSLYYGGDWWMHGVPLSIRVECDTRWNEDLGAHERRTYLYLINYADIALFKNNWELFKAEYDFYGSGNKQNQVSWIRKLNDIRKITHHAEKWPLDVQQVEFVEKIYLMVKEHIEKNQPVKKGQFLRPVDLNEKTNTG